MSNMYKLGDICSIGSSKRIHKADYVDEGIPFYRSKEIIELSNGQSITEPLFISDEKYNEIKNRFPVPEKDDILITSVGTIGITYLVKNPNFYFKDGNLTWLRNLDSNIVNVNYLMKWLKSSHFKSQITNNNIGAVQKAITIDYLKQVNIPLPDLSTQKSIAKVLSDLDTKIELNNKINRELEAMAKTLYDYWFVQFDFPANLGDRTLSGAEGYKSSGGKMVYNEELKREIPEEWEVKKLGELVYQVNDGISPKEYPDLPYLPIDKLPMKQLYYSEYESRSEANSSLIRFKENDILLGAMRVYFHRVCHAISDGISRSTIIVLRPFKDNFKNFALFTLNKNEVIEFASNNSTGTSIPYAKWNDSLENYLIGIPKEDNILTMFNKVIEPALDHFKVLNKQNQQLTNLRDWLLPMLMNGQVTVKESQENFQ